MKKTLLILFGLVEMAFGQGQSIDSNGEFENHTQSAPTQQRLFPHASTDVTGNKGSQLEFGTFDELIELLLSGDNSNSLQAGNDGGLFVANNSGEITTYFDDDISDPTATPQSNPANPSLGQNLEEVANGWYRKFEWDGNSWIVVADLELCLCPELTYDPIENEIIWDNDSNAITPNLVIPLEGETTINTTTSSNANDTETSGVSGSSFTIDLTGVGENDWDDAEAPVILRAEDTLTQAGWDVDIDNRHGNIIVVATNGVDPTNPGALRVYQGETYSNYSQMLPFLTIGMASLSAQPGDTIVVRSGNYDETSATDGDPNGFVEAIDVNYHFDNNVTITGSVNLSSPSEQSWTGYPNIIGSFGIFEINNIKRYNRLELGTVTQTDGSAAVQMASNAGVNYAYIDIREAIGSGNGGTGVGISNYELYGVIRSSFGETLGVQVTNPHAGSVLRVDNARTPLGTSDNNQIAFRIRFTNAATNQSSTWVDAPVIKIGSISGSHEGLNIDSVSLEYRPVVVEGGRINRASDSTDIRGVPLFVGNNSKAEIKNTIIGSYLADGQTIAAREAIRYSGGTGPAQTPTPANAHPVGSNETVLRLHNVTLISDGNQSINQAVNATLYLWCYDVKSRLRMQTQTAAGSFTGILAQALTGDNVSHGGDGINFMINADYE